MAEKRKRKPAADGRAKQQPQETSRKAFLLRLSPALHAELREWAAADMRSLNAQIEFLLRAAVKRRRP